MKKRTNKYFMLMTILFFTSLAPYSTAISDENIVCKAHIEGNKLMLVYHNFSEDTLYVADQSLARTGNILYCDGTGNISVEFYLYAASNTSNEKENSGLRILLGMKTIPPQEKLIVDYTIKKCNRKKLKKIIVQYSHNSPYEESRRDVHYKEIEVLLE